jgi:hypothetical protein
VPEQRRRAPCQESPPQAMETSHAIGARYPCLDMDQDADKRVLGLPCRLEGPWGAARMDRCWPYGRRFLHTQRVACQRTSYYYGTVHILGLTWWSCRWVGVLLCCRFVTRHDL